MVGTSVKRICTLLRITMAICSSIRSIYGLADVNSGIELLQHRWAKCCLEHGGSSLNTEILTTADPTSLSHNFVRRRRHSPRFSLLWIDLQRAVDIDFSEGVPGDQRCADDAQHIVRPRDAPRLHEEEFWRNLDCLWSRTSLQLHNEPYWCTIDE